MDQQHIAKSVKIRLITALTILVLPIMVNAAGITVKPGASISLGGGTIDLGCTDASISGALDLISGSVLNARHFSIDGGSVNAGNGLVQMAGNWNNSGTFVPGVSQVTVQDGCLTTISALTGDTRFHSFTASSNNGKTLEAAAGSTQLFDGSFTLQGKIGNPLLIRSSETGNQAFFILDPIGIQQIDAVDVRDNNASGVAGSGQWLAQGLASNFNSVDSGNNLNWFLNVVNQVSVPTLSWPALLILALALMSAAIRRQRINIKTTR